MENLFKKNEVNNVLFVDSDEKIYAAIQALAKKEEEMKAGIRYYLAKNAKEALEKMNETEIRLVITEIVLPVISGYHLIKAIRKDHGGIPIIIYTRLKKPQDFAKMAASGASNIYLKELMNIEQLVQKIENGEKLESLDETVLTLNKEIKNLMESEAKHVQKLTQCPKCNLMIPPDSHFCNNCGQQIAQEKKEVLVQKPVESKEADVTNAKEVNIKEIETKDPETK